MISKNKISVLLVVSIAFFACNKGIDRHDLNTVFRYNEHSNINSLDPAFSKDISDIWVVNQLFNGLVQLDENLQVQADIARHWDISEDGLSYTFFLREDVYFHKHSLFGIEETRLVNAHDFVYSFERLQNNAIASPGRWVLQNVAYFESLDEMTFRIVLKRPFPPFLGLLTMKYCSVVPKEIVAYYGSDFRSNPIGTGPFQFKLWVENTKLVLRKNLLYFEGDSTGIQLPYLEAVAITFLPDKQSEYLQFVQGNIDLLNSVDPSYKDDLLTAEGSLKNEHKEKFNMITSPYLNTEYLGIFMEDSISDTHSIHVRKAMNYGFDRVKMIRYLRNGIGTPGVNGFIPVGLPSFKNIEGYTYQPEKAAALINRYKKESGDPSPEITITTNSQYMDLCEYIQRELEQIGLKVHIDVVPPSTLRQAKASGKLPVFRASWVADYPDAENYLSLFYSKNFVPDGPNYTHFKNDYFDELFERSYRLVDDKLRHALYASMDSLLLEQAPIVPLYYDQAVRFTQKNIENLGINAVNQLSLKKVKKSAQN